MRIDVKKFLFMGATKDKATFFKEAQIAGIIEFIHPSGRKHISYPPVVEHLSNAIKILRSFFHEPQDSRKTLAETEAIAERVLQVQKNLSDNEEKKRVVLQEIERLTPFGNFEVEEIHLIEEEAKLKFRFFCAKTSKHLDDVLAELILINSKDGIDYFIALYNAPLVHPDLIEVTVTESLHTLHHKLAALNLGIEESLAALKEFTRYYSLLHQALLHRINEVNLGHAQDSSEFELENQLFVVEGWVPKTERKALDVLTSKFHIYQEEVALENFDVAPTCLHNQGAGRIGEDVIRVFDIPSNSDKDPSLWVLFFFTLFFSMIVYDGGYGLIFLAVALYLRFKMTKKTAQAKRFIGLMTVLALGCTLWGGMTHSFFGVEISPDNFFRKHSLMTWLVEKKAAYHIAHNDDVYQGFVAQYPDLAKVPTAKEFVHYPVNKESAISYPVAAKLNDNVLMELALFCGALHICFGLLRYVRYNPVGAGWIAFIFGAYLYIPHYLHAASLIYYVFGVDPAAGAQFGLQLVFFGVALAVLIGTIMHGISGIFEFMHSIQVFGDVLSYLRIYALGTAGYIVSETVNHMASQMPLLLAIVLLIIGHFINILLSVMGGTIHGLRLNFLEWYRYSFFGGGKDFQPLKLKTLE